MFSLLSQIVWFQQLLHIKKLGEREWNILKKINWEDRELKEILNQVEKNFEGGSKDIRDKEFQKT